MATTIGKRNSVWQEVRGLCIIAVIMIHLPIGTIENDTYNYWLSFRQIINFPVACFIFIAGYFSKSTYSEIFRRGRGSKLLIPYLLWTLIYTGLFFVLSIWQHTEYMSWQRVITNLFLGQSIAPLYFIVVLVQLTLLTPIIHWVITSPRKFYKVICILITPAYLLFLYSYSCMNSAELPYYAVVFPAWFCFYYSGVYIQHHGFIKIKLLHVFIGAIMALILSLFESNIISNNTHLIGLASSQIKFSSFMYAAILCILFGKLSHIDQSDSQTTLSRIGDYSYGIYYIHMLFLIAGSFVLSKLAVFSTEGTFLIKQILLTISTVIMCYYSIKICHKILPAKINQYLGF